MSDVNALFEQAVKACADYIAARRIENASDNDDDVTLYSTDTEVVEIYLVKELAEDISAALPAAIQAQLSNTPE